MRSPRQRGVKRLFSSCRCSLFLPIQTAAQRRSTSSYHDGLRWPVILVFSGLSLLSLGTTVAWLHLDHTAPTWDDAIYLTNSLQLFDALSDGGIIRYTREFLTLMDTKPPLLVTLPT